MTQTEMALKPKRTFHAAKIQNSPRLQRVLAFLISRYPFVGATSWEICQEAHVINCGGATAELNAAINGFHIECTEEPRICPSRIFRYFLRENERLRRYLKEQK